MVIRQGLGLKLQKILDYFIKINIWSILQIWNICNLTQFYAGAPTKHSLLEYRLFYTP